MKCKFYIRSVLAGTVLWAQTAVVQAQFTYFYVTNNGAITIVGGNGSGVMVVPGTINGLPVTSIGPGVYDDPVFENPYVTAVIITNGVTSSIADWAFSHCAALTNVVLGSSITNIGYYVFGDCPNLTQITIDPANPSFASSGDVLFDKSQKMLIRYPNGLAGDYAVPAGVTSIAPSAFSRCSHLTGITFPNSLINIGSNAFNLCSGLTSVIVPDSVTDIGTCTFARCTDLTNITLGTGVTTIGSLAFIFCTNLTSVAIPGNVTQIGSDAFDFCSGLTNLTLGAGVAGVGSSAFWSCTSLISVLIPNSVTNLGNNSFRSCTGLSNVTIGSGVTHIGTNALYWCTNLIGISVDSLNPTYSSVDGVLFNKNQTILIQCPDGLAGNYTIPNEVATIGVSAFSDSSLGTITIPSSVTTIAASAFDDCENLTGLYFEGNAPIADATAFNYDTNATVYYLSGTTGWSSSFDGLPAVPWSLQMIANPLNLGVHANQFGFNITGPTNLVVVIEACTNFFNPMWQPIQTNVLTGGSAYFSDPQWTNYPGRFYRLRLP